ncbi:hypothetical protein Peur_067166 [Populus x canadensis]
MNMCSFEEDTILPWCSMPLALSLCRQAYVWSCGVTLYVMLVGSYPVEDPDEPIDVGKTIQDSIQITPRMLPPDFKDFLCRSCKCECFLFFSFSFCWILKIVLKIFQSMIYL